MVAAGAAAPWSRVRAEPGPVCRVRHHRRLSAGCERPVWRLACRRGALGAREMRDVVCASMARSAPVRGRATGAELAQLGGSRHRAALRHWPECHRHRRDAERDRRRHARCVGHANLARCSVCSMESSAMSSQRRHTLRYPGALRSQHPARDTECRASCCVSLAEVGRCSRDLMVEIADNGIDHRWQHRRASQ